MIKKDYKDGYVFVEEGDDVKWYHKVMISFVFCSLMIDWDRLVG